MKITALVENRPEHGLKAVHGLSLYIETTKHRLLFDLGPDATLLENAEKLGVELTAVDTVILSHGHYDHGGALKAFLQINPTALIYAQRKAFEPHYSKALEKKYIGLDPELKNNPRIRLVDGDCEIDDELRLFTVTNADKCYSPANDTLYDENGNDGFEHEQSLLIRDRKTVLVMGCGHVGVVNILEKARPFAPAYCVGGYHLYYPRLQKTVPEALLAQIAAELRKYPHISFYTCHCTGEEAYRYLAERVPDMHYLACGDSLTIPA